MEKKDTTSIDAMKRGYLRNVDRGIAGMKANSMRVYGRVIPQVLLTHLGGWSAVTREAKREGIKLAGEADAGANADANKDAAAEPALDVKALCR